MFQPMPTKLKRGYASFHHPLTIHGSFGNTSERPRRATVINVFRDGVASASEKPLLEGVPVIPPSQPLRGQFFPLLFDPERAGLSDLP
jgi:ectoine hydroxylase-related dioxygenase (phytanoyl-CoA dioxygenase family)